MLNQTSDRSVESRSGWCVGEPPLRWDVSFGARLAEKVRQLFWRDGGDRPLPIKSAVAEQNVVVARKAA